ncbi:hypothetical protein Lser_V15G23760 [Lactuca serriola]
MSDYLNEGLIFEIFIRLPPKSLLRFRSLSKSLCSFISSPRFIHMHTFQSPKKLLIQHQTYESKDFYTLHSEDQIPLDPRRGYIRTTPVNAPYLKYSIIVGACNDIFCLFHYQENRISLWNFSIRRKITLPDCPQRCFSGVQIGFGFDPINNDYKIVKLPTYGGREESSFVYTIKTDAWSEIASPTPVFHEVLLNAYFVNGALHWVVERHYNNLHDVERFYILKFDLGTHVFDMITLPEPSSKTARLTSVRGFLAVISGDCDGCWVWVRRVDSWNVVYKMKRKHVFDGGLLSVVQLTTNGDLLLLCEGFQIYNPKIGVPSRLVDFGSDSYIVGTEMCVETLQLFDVATATS